MEKKLHNAKLWATGAKARSHKAGQLYQRRGPQTKEYGDQRYRQLNAHQDALREQGVGFEERRARIKEEKALIDADLEQRWQQVRQTYAKSSKESQKYDRYAQQQCDLLRALEELKASERTMYELDNRKDQVMTVCKLALANLVMWTVSFNIRALGKREQRLYDEIERSLHGIENREFPARPLEPARCPTCPFFFICPA